ncbi:MAG: hypothetical protein M3Q91_01750, partial [Acidobacteriota bacterium]|nr:hypothetical protein [Acidobacteriota bacterium]
MVSASASALLLKHVLSTSQAYEEEKQRDYPASRADGLAQPRLFATFDGGKEQFITFRLEDSMPQAILDRWRIALEKEGDANFDSVLRRRVEPV